MAAPAANLQQKLPCRLKHEPGEAAGVGRVEALIRPPGLPDRPFSNGRPRNRPGGFGEMSLLIVNSFFQSAARSRRRDW
jgi:hypothetical protein